MIIFERKVIPTKDKVHLIVSKSLAFEVRKAQEMINSVRKKRKLKQVNLIQASDYVAQIFRRYRYNVRR